MKLYAGIGSRDVPEDIQEMIRKIATKLAQEGHILRSGGASGCDTVFEIACDEQGGKKEIFLPWKGFGNKWDRIPDDNDFKEPKKEALSMAQELVEEYGDFSKNCNNWIWRLLSRNMHQVLGYSLDNPVQFVVCYTKDGKEIGGTRWAIRIARRYKIPIFNLGDEKTRDNLLKE